MDGLAFTLCVVAPAATFIGAMFYGQWRLVAQSVMGAARLLVFWTGAFGITLQVVCCCFAAFPHARITDSIDWGPWSGVPTPLVMLLLLLSAVLLIAMVVIVALDSLAGSRFALRRDGDAARYPLHKPRKTA